MTGSRSRSFPTYTPLKIRKIFLSTRTRSSRHSCAINTAAPIWKTSLRMLQAAKCQRATGTNSSAHLTTARTMALRSKPPRSRMMLSSPGSIPCRIAPPTRFVSRNCADFVREVLDFYYPHSVSRGIDCRPLRQHAETCGEVAGQVQQAPSGFGIHAICHSPGSRQREAQQAGARRARVGFPGKEICRGSGGVSPFHCRRSVIR